MTKKLLLPLGILLLLSAVFYFYQLNSRALNTAAAYANSISLEYYTRRGMSQKKPSNSEKLNIGSEIYKIDALFSQAPLEAAVKYESLLKKDPGNSSLHLRLGMIYLKLQQQSAAKEHFYFVYENMDSGLQPDAAWFLGLISVLEAEQSEAKDYLKECIAKKCSYRKEAEKLMALL